MAAEPVNTYGLVSKNEVIEFRDIEGSLNAFFSQKWPGRQSRLLRELIHPVYHNGKAVRQCRGGCRAALGWP
jgi:hypothetical protein